MKRAPDSMALEPVKAKVYLDVNIINIDLRQSWNALHDKRVLVSFSDAN
jgi:hypothetical protein